MAARMKRWTGWSEKDICSEEVGVCGLTYDETSVVYSLLWSQPSLHGGGYTRRRANPLVRNGSRGDGVCLPPFCTESPDHPISEGDEGGSEEEDPRSNEIHEVHPSTVQRVQPWRSCKRKLVDNVPPTPEADVAGRVRSELGYVFPPVMGKMVENSVQSKWLKWRERGVVGGQNRDEEEEQKMYHQLVVDAQVFLAKEIERKLVPESQD